MARLAKLRTSCSFQTPAEIGIGIIPNWLLSVLKRRLSARPFLLPGMQAAGISSTIPGGVRVPTVPPTRGRVLLLGSGYVSAPILEYLSKTTNYELSIGTDRVHDGERLVSWLQSVGVNREVAVTEVDVQDSGSLGPLVRGQDLCISAIPNFLHCHVLKQCLEHGVHLVTPSYSTADFEAADDEARERGLTVFCEQGLDPGIDHMLAMECIDHAHAKGGVVTGFISYCGGLPAPENADNPLGYKFSWSPKSVLLNTVNAAEYLSKSEVVAIPSGGELMSHFKEVPVYGCQFEGVPNRSSLKYRSLYGIHQVESLLRGSLRNKSFCENMTGLRLLGLLSTEQHPRLQLGGADMSWRDILGMLLAASDVRSDSLEGAVRQAVGGREGVVTCLEQLGLLSSERVECCGSPVDTLAHHLDQLLSYKDGERDMVVLQHVIDVRYPTHKERHTVAMEAYGQPRNSHSAMALTVGLPVAMTAKMILNGSLKQRGLVLPLTANIYQPILAELREMSKDWATWTETVETLA